MSKVPVVMAVTAIGMALLSCSAPQLSTVRSPTSSPMADEPSAPVIRAPLSPLAGYAPQPPLTNSQTSLVPYGNSPSDDAEPQTAALGAWRASPRWAAVTGEGCIVVEQGSQNATQAQNEKFKVENCTEEDVNHLSPAQVEQRQRHSHRKPSQVHSEGPIIAAWLHARSGLECSPH